MYITQQSQQEGILDIEMRENVNAASSVGIEMGSATEMSIARKTVVRMMIATGVMAKEMRLREMTVTTNLGTWEDFLDCETSVRGF
jgi:hypothetical protein